MRGATVAAVMALVAASCSDSSASREKFKREQPIVAAAEGHLVLSGRVVDAAKLLTAAQVQRLSADSEKLERETHHQLVVVTTPSLGGRDVGAYARDLANRWHLGRRGYNDGVVLLVAPNEHKVRIAVGYGLERQLTNATCKHILETAVLPHFRQIPSDFGAGIEAGTDALIEHLRPTSNRSSERSIPAVRASHQSDA